MVGCTQKCSGISNQEERSHVSHLVRHPLASSLEELEVVAEKLTSVNTAAPVTRTLIRGKRWLDGCYSEIHRMEVSKILGFNASMY